MENERLDQQIEADAETSEAVFLATVREALSNGIARGIRVEAGLSLAEAAPAGGTSAPVLSRWESGKVRPRKKAALRYGHFLVELNGLKGLLQ